MFIKRKKISKFKKAFLKGFNLWLKKWSKKIKKTKKSSFFWVSFNSSFSKKNKVKKQKNKIDYFKRAQKRLKSNTWILIWENWDREITFRKNWLYSDTWMWSKFKKFSTRQKRF